MCYLQLLLIVGCPVHPHTLHFRPLVNPVELAQLLCSQEYVEVVRSNLSIYQKMIGSAGNLSMEAIEG